MNRLPYTCVLFLVLTVSLSSCLKQNDDIPPVLPPGSGNVTFNWSTIADTAERSLDYFWSASGKYYLSSNTANDWAQYWPNAHALDVLVDAYLRNPSTTLKTQMNDLLTGVRTKNGNTFINYYYDDMEWMALATLRAYSATNDARFKGICDTLWDDIKKGWSSSLGGGIWWRKDNPS